jgi:hypothetical protein
MNEGLWSRDGRRILRAGVLIALAIALLKGSWDLGRPLSLEARGALDFDTLIYFIVGRGILNGLKPYADLFESKPPGMFLVTALSLAVTGGPWLATALDIAGKLSLPVMLAVFAASEARRNGAGRNVLPLCCTAFLMGTMISIFLVDRVGAVQTEGFGSFFACGYLLHVAWRESKGWRPIVLRSLLLTGAIGMKEPFLLAVVGSVVLVARDWRDCWRAFIVPLAVAAAIGLVGLWVAGYADGYLSTYLPAMLGKRITSNPAEPLFVRSFSVAKVLYNVTAAYGTWGFGVTLASLWVLYPLWRVRRTDLVGLVLILVGSALGFFVLRFTYVLAVVFHAAHLLGIKVWVPFVYAKVGEYAGLTVTFLAVLHFQRRRGIAGHTLTAMAATLPISAGVGVAGYALQHWAFACPFYFALALAFIRYAARERIWVISGTISGMVVATLLLFGPSQDRVRFLERDVRNHSERANAETVGQFDALLDACHVVRYAGLDVHEALAFSKHSPMGPLFIQRAHQYLGEDHPLFSATYRNMEDDAQILVMKEGDTPWGRFAALASEFADEPPACAEGRLPIRGLDIRFRRR